MMPPARPNDAEWGLKRLGAVKVAFRSTTVMEHACPFTAAKTRKIDTHAVKIHSRLCKTPIKVFTNLVNALKTVR